MTHAQVGVKEGYPLKKWLFYWYWLSRVKKVEAKHRHRPTACHNKHYSDELLNGVDIDDFE